MTYSFSSVDYDKHPAFISYNSFAPQTDTTLIQHCWTEIDKAVNLIKNSEEYLSESFIERYLCAQINPLITEISRITGSYMPSNAWFQDVVTDALSKTSDTIKKELLYENDKKHSTYQVIHAPLTKKVNQELRTQGVSFTKFPQEYLDIVFNSLSSERVQITEMVKNDPTKLHSLPLPLGGQYFKITHELLKAYGIMDGATMFAEHQLEIIYVTLCLSCSSQNWFRDCYADIGVGTSSLAYLHLDHDFDVVKVLMYLLHQVNQHHLA
jgi:hypothetical protein